MAAPPTTGRRSVGGRAPTLRDAVRTYQLTSPSPIPTTPPYRPSPPYPTTFTSVWRGTLDNFSQNHPKPFAYQFYVTVTDPTSVSSTMPEELPRELFDALVDGKDFSEWEHWRIDVWYFPGAEMEACMEHYERKVEWEQEERIRRAEDADLQPVAGGSARSEQEADGGSKGLEEEEEEGSGTTTTGAAEVVVESVPSYYGNNWGTVFHHLFFMVDTPHWRVSPTDPGTGLPLASSSSTSSSFAKKEEEGETLSGGGIQCIQFDKHPDEPLEEASGDVTIPNDNGDGGTDTILRRHRVQVVADEESDDDSLCGGNGKRKTGGLGAWLQSIWNMAEVRGDYY